MGIEITKQEIISTSEVVRNFSKIRTEVKENSRMIVFKNNKPDLVLLDFDEYEKLLEHINIMEDLLISKTIEERDKEDNGTRHSFDDAKLLSEKNY